MQFFRGKLNFAENGMDNELKQMTAVEQFFALDLVKFYTLRLLERSDVYIGQ